MCGRGFLTVWSDVDPERETDYIHWLTREHAVERVSTPGFLAVRVFRATVAGASRYLIVYELESPDIVDSPEYVARLNNPTPWTQATFRTLRNFLRAGGRIAQSQGAGQGGVVAALTFADAPPGNAAPLVADIARGDRIAAARLYETDHRRTAVKTREKEVRQVADDRSFAAMLLIEGMDAPAVEAALARLGELAPDIVRGSTVGASVYGAVFTLEKRFL